MTSRGELPKATFIPNFNPETNQGIIEAQAQVAANDPFGFAGAQTDDMIGPVWRAPDLIHFNGTGLVEHAARWHTSIESFFSPPSVLVEPEARKLLDGEVFAGQLSDVTESDDVDWVLDPSATSNPFKQKIDVLLVSETEVQSPSSFGFCLESAMLGGPSGDVIQTIRVWKFATRSWHVLDSRAVATINDDQIIVHASGNLSEHVHPLTGEIIARVTWESPSFGGLPFTWSIDIDQAVWLIGD